MNTIVLFEDLFDIISVVLLQSAFETTLSFTNFVKISRSIAVIL